MICGGIGGHHGLRADLQTEMKLHTYCVPDNVNDLYHDVDCCRSESLSVVVVDLGVWL